MPPPGSPISISAKSGSSCRASRPRSSRPSRSSSSTASCSRYWVPDGERSPSPSSMPSRRKSGAWPVGASINTGRLSSSSRPASTSSSEEAPGRRSPRDCASASPFLRDPRRPPSHCPWPSTPCPGIDRRPGGSPSAPRSPPSCTARTHGDSGEARFPRPRPWGRRISPGTSSRDSPGSSSALRAACSCSARFSCSRSPPWSPLSVPPQAPPADCRARWPGASC